MTEANSARPLLEQTLTGAELLRWYWLKDELVDFARALGLGVGGGKEALTTRIAAHLDGEEFHEAKVNRVTARGQLGSRLTADTVIPIGQRCSQNLRRWFDEQIGPSFRFNQEMRDFFAHTDGTQTLDDALQHWHATRERGPNNIDRQFEFNRFTRAWHLHNPQGTRQELLVAWAGYRAAPVDKRGRI